MVLTNDLLSQFAKITNDNEEQSTENTVYGTIVESDGTKYVRLDGSNIDTPISTTTDASHGDRVTVMIKNHSAVVTGNITSPSAKKQSVDDLGERTDDLSDQVTAFGQVVAKSVTTDQLNAESARIEQLIVTGDAQIRGELQAVDAKIENLDVGNLKAEVLEAVDAKIENLDADYVKMEVLEGNYAKIESLEATNVEVRNLSGDFADFKDVTTDNFTALDATIVDLQTKKLDTETAEITYANIDFANIGEAAFEKIFSEFGIIKDLVVENGAIVTGELVGVTIKGDLIEGNTIKADKLVVKGSDGLYYKLNFEAGAFQGAEEVPLDSIHGSAITAHSITAEKVSVSDLVAFGATIGGFNITSNSLYSGVKESIDNTTTGVYMDNEGQMAIGDASNYLKFYKDGDSYKLDISASSLKFASRQNTLEEELTSIDERFEETNSNIDEKINESKGLIDASEGRINDRLTPIETYVSIDDDGITIGSNDSKIVLKIDNTNGIEFYKKGETTPFGKWDGNFFHTGNIMIETDQRAQFGNFAFVPRSNGSLSFLKVGG